MNENNFDPKTTDDSQIEKIEKVETSEMFVNDYGSTVDSTVVVEEADRTVLLTENETIVIAKQPIIDIAPKNRPRKVYGGMWGQTEIATVGVGLLAILTVILLFVFLVVPAKKELEANRTERDRLERELTTAKSRYGSITSTEEQVARLVSSVDDFETRFLPSATNGRTAVYQRINGLISAYGLTNTTGPDYAPLEIAAGGNGQASEEESGRAKFQSIFPGVYVTMTLEGSYQNLRRFIREVETSDQFVVVSAVELEPSENNEKENQTADGATQTSAAPVSTPFVNPINPQLNQPQNGQFGTGSVGAAPPQQTAAGRPRQQAPKGKTHGETVSLRLEMAAYFRRPNFVPRAVESIEQ